MSFPPDSKGIPMDVQTVSSLLKSVTDDDLVAKVQEIYEEGLELDYRRFLKQIRTMVPRTSEFLCALVREDGITHIYGRKLGDDQNYPLTITCWQEILAMPIIHIPPETFVSNVDTLAHIIWEMTFTGFSNEEHTDAREAVEEALDEVKRAIEENDFSGFKTWTMPKSN